MKQSKVPTILTSEELLRKVIREELKDYATKSDLEKIEMRMDAKGQEYRDDVLNKMDEVVGELENIRLDRELSVHQTREQQDQLDNHEKRIAKLEQPQ